MAQPQPQPRIIIRETPIGKDLDAFRASFEALYAVEDVSESFEKALDQLDPKDDRELAFTLLLTLQVLRAARLLRAANGKPVLAEILRLVSSTVLGESDVDRLTPLLGAALSSDSMLSSLQQTPWLRNTSSFANSSEHCKYMGDVFKEELGSMYTGIPDFHESFFGAVTGLEQAASAVFAMCVDGDNPLYREGWAGWPSHPEESQPNTPIDGSTARRKLDIGFSNPKADSDSRTGLDLGRYAREVLTAQDTRRFVLVFTICGHLMQVWEFDRLGGTASQHFDVNKDGLRDEEQLGFDPTIITTAGEQYTEITRDGHTERLIIDDLMQRAACVAGRATTCWKAHRAGDPQTLLVIKDSWQRSAMSPLTSAAGVSETSLNGGRKRSSSREAARLPPSKRSRSESSAPAEEGVSANRIHRRVILRDYGRPIFTASSRESLLGALEAYITGHESSHNAGFLHRNISVNNLIVNEDEDNASGVKGNTGTRAFMAIGVLRGEKYTFMHDHESFFCVLFWICIHYKGTGRGRIVPEFDKWNCLDMATLAYINQGQVSDERDFIRLAQENFTPFYRPLIRWAAREAEAIIEKGEAVAE
ncbi:hypothetical protein B0T24DRAFT_708101 [Lasiosphaeria ovina]|uniref:Fungal-type protein kinase domain-containing protein n=1 Tax=Lasiosphaeria ovina TaxID=92902 RepID=A0AAE0K3Y0_9PEZI|nr:hypothetical protein B0T24DRAFT_708101 [Lasiosphaeria ovina]